MTAKRMTREQRWEWLLRRLMEPQQAERIDVTDDRLVNDFIFASGASWILRMQGAHKCQTLEKDLSAMHVRGLLERERRGIGRKSGQGLPNWAYSYRLGRGAAAFLLNTRSEADA